MDECEAVTFTVLAFIPAGTVYVSTPSPFLTLTLYVLSFTFTATLDGNPFLVLVSMCFTLIVTFCPAFNVLMFGVSVIVVDPFCTLMTPVFVTVESLYLSFPVYIASILGSCLIHDPGTRYLILAIPLLTSA